jgi:YHS domain-containing protein
MYTRIVLSRVLQLAIAVFVGGVAVRTAEARSSTSGPNEQHQHAAPTAEQPHDEHDAQMAREGSGTSWLPDATPMYAVHSMKGPWTLMFHGNAFLQYLKESGDRGDDQFGSINWVMAMAQRNAGPGRVMFRGMFSAEPWTIRGCGYPDLLASGEQCEGEKIHNRQHPHDLMMELSASYDAPLKGPVRWQVYGGPVGEPALGPVAYPHRVSAMPNPLAPIAHHWLDSTHITYGVLTGGLYGNRWKAEASVFNGREPDEDRADFDFGALDSFSGRFWFLPTSKVALQVSAGKLAEAEAGEGETPRLDVSRVSASATYHTGAAESRLWATTVAWGRNEESGRGSNAVLVETNLTWQDRDTVFGRFEGVSKTAHDLAVAESDEAFTVAKLQGGYTRYLPTWNGLKPGVGMSLSAGFVPEGLKSAYGSRVNGGFGVFLTLRPAAMMMPAGHQAGGGAADHSGHAASPAVDHSQHTAPSQAAPSRPAAHEAPAAAPAPGGEPRLPVTEAERVIDPNCAATIDRVNAPKATYQRKVYYFCSTADRDEFVKDPAAYLKKRGGK